MPRKVRSPEYAAIYESLGGLTIRQIVDCMKLYVSREDAEAFAVLVDGLSWEAVRLLAARALVRLRTSEIAESAVPEIATADGVARR
jgi:hypothetical protein